MKLHSAQIVLYNDDQYCSKDAYETSTYDRYSSDDHLQMARISGQVNLGEIWEHQVVCNNYPRIFLILPPLRLELVDVWTPEVFSSLKSGEVEHY